MRFPILICLWVSAAVPAAAQDLDIRVLPDIVYVEELDGPIIPTRRVFFHAIFHNVTAEPIEFQWVRFDLVGTTGAVVSGQFSGSALTALFDDSVRRRRIESTVANTLVLSPDQRKAVSDVFLTLPSELVGTTLVVESEYRRGETVSAQKVSVPLMHTEGFIGRLPFDGIWYVAAEHDALDPHKRFTSEAFAYDFLQIGVDGRSYVGRGTRNSDYYAYGQPVLAAADGEVVYMRNDIPENVPGRAMPATPGGNAIAIRHADDRYTYYAHMRPSGIRVGVGDQVLAGDPIGEVGNSGDSVEPHLHFHAMSGPDGAASPGIPVLFESWISGAYGQRAAVRRAGTLPRGDFVTQP
jgi:murein DD-endopeptidase MepM/ murein hydrolase activator NlpD